MNFFSEEREEEKEKICKQQNTISTWFELFFVSGTTAMAYQRYLVSKKRMFFPNIFLNCFFFCFFFFLQNKEDDDVYGVCF